MLVLKWLKINCLMLYSQKNKCLVLSKYPHSDPRESVNIENWKLQSIFNFCFSAKTLKIVDRTTQEGGGGVHSHGNFCP